MNWHNDRKKDAIMLDHARPAHEKRFVDIEMHSFTQSHARSEVEPIDFYLTSWKEWTIACEWRGTDEEEDAEREAKIKRKKERESEKVTTK